MISFRSLTAYVRTPYHSFMAFVASRKPSDSVNDGAKALRQWRKDHEVSQRRLCKEMDVAARMLHEWEFGAKIPNLHNALKLEWLTEGVVPIELWGYSVDDLAVLGRCILARLARIGHPFDGTFTLGHAEQVFGSIDPHKERQASGKGVLFFGEGPRARALGNVPTINDIHKPR